MVKQIQNKKTRSNKTSSNKSLRKRKIERRKKMGKIVVKNAVERKPGYLYYIDGEGNLCEALMHRKGKTANKKKKE
jgi:hypothetical protein